jgi:hypothetical protein
MFALPRVFLSGLSITSDGVRLVLTLGWLPLYLTAGHSSAIAFPSDKS